MLTSPDIDGYVKFKFKPGHFNALRYAAEIIGDNNCVKMLLEAKANPNGCFVKGIGTAIAGAQAAGHLDCMKTLLDSKSDPNRRVSEAETLLIYAANRGLADQIQLLVDAKADVAETDFGLSLIGNTALSIALKNEDEPSIQILKKAKAKQDKEGFFSSLWSTSPALPASKSEAKDSLEPKKLRP